MKIIQKKFLFWKWIKVIWENEKDKEDFIKRSSRNWDKIIKEMKAKLSQ